jgi:uncharacterized protein (TIGR02996 family)
MTTHAADPMHRAFLDDILANPSDDFPRLVYADWLADHGEERAEFIRVQVELARCEMPDPDDKPRWDERTRLQTLAESLLRANGPDWHPSGTGEQYAFRPSELATFSFGPRELFVLASWRRGFIAEVRCPLAQFLQHGPEIAARHPIETVRLVGREPWKPGGEGLWFWHAARTPDHDELPDFLPLCWFDAEARRTTHRSLEDAHAWASQRAILWARGLLGTTTEEGRA